MAKLPFMAMPLYTRPEMLYLVLSELSRIEDRVESNLYHFPHYREYGSSRPVSRRTVEAHKAARRFLRGQLTAHFRANDALIGVSDEEQANA
jgi:hypothetical protein